MSLRGIHWQGNGDNKSKDRWSSINWTKYTLGFCEPIANFDATCQRHVISAALACKTFGLLDCQNATNICFFSHPLSPNGLWNSPSQLTEKSTVHAPLWPWQALFWWSWCREIYRFNHKHNSEPYLSKKNRSLLAAWNNGLMKLSWTISLRVEI